MKGSFVMKDKKKDVLSIIDKIDTDMSDVFLTVKNCQKTMDRAFDTFSSNSPEIDSIISELGKINNSLLEIHNQTELYRQNHHK